MQAPLVTLSFAELRDRLKARFVDLEGGDDLDLAEVLRYLNAVPDDAHTPDSVDALIELARNFFFVARPVEALDLASRASHLAAARGESLLLCDARAIEGLTLSDLGRFSEAAAAHAESWDLARSCGAIEKELWAMKRVGDLWGAMAQFDVALTYLARACELAAQHGLRDLHLAASNNMANFSTQLRDPMTGLRVLLPLVTGPEETKVDVMRHANAHDTLGHLYLLLGDIDNARKHANESGRLARLAGVERTIRRNQTLLGLIDVSSGQVSRGLEAVESGLAFTKQVNHIDMVEYLGMCVLACEFAGQPDRGLMYLQELVDWKMKSIGAVVLPLQYDVLAEPLTLHTGNSEFDKTLVARSRSLHADMRQSHQRLVETAINAEVTNGYDLYRVFRLGKLSRCLASVVGWNEDRVAAVTLAAQLCNVGLVAIPSRLLQKPRGLSDGERDIIRAHTYYGAELLRKSKLRALDLASTVAEQHHERFDGNGYPRGLSGDAISDEARIVAICDAFDAMTHQRPWRRAPLSVQAALNELKRGAGSQFDPFLVRAFTEFVHRKFWEHENFDAFLAEGADEHEYVRVRARMDAMIAGD